MRLALEDAYARDERVYINNERPGIPEADFWARPAAERTPALVFGHFSYRLHEAVPLPSRYVTMLREPVERVRSVAASAIASNAGRSRPHTTETSSVMSAA